MVELDYLQIFLYANFFIIGIVITIAAQHAYAHFKQPAPIETKKTAHAKDNETIGAHLPPSVKEHLLNEVQSKFQNVIDHSTAELDHDLEIIIDKIDKRIEKLGTEIVNGEIRRYQTKLDELRKRAEINIVSAQAGIAKHQAELQAKLADNQKELEAKMNQEIAEEKKRLSEQVDAKLSDAVASFLIETLGHNIDLGSQNDYLIEMLESHKSELVKGVTNEA